MATSRLGQYMIRRALERQMRELQKEMATPQVERRVPPENLYQPYGITDEEKASAEARVEEASQMTTPHLLLSELADRFNPVAAAGLEVIYQFELTDGEPGYIQVQHQKLVISGGSHPEPSVTLIMESETLRGLMNGEVDGMQAFMAGLIKADGDMLLATKLTRLFPPG
ncbi:SCP2 sterol-binding domain-containing protein [Pokkaliibacter sp. CJK22405]|uniref:SCP2 sterol-binding domain-containing protein n=1 Tax=Pokkaliibacter sp. CJK22405 TaxID=3384615 RepID=UPI003984F73A